MTDFLFALNHLAPLDPRAIDDIKIILCSQSYEKGELLLREGQVCKKLYFIDKGLAKTFFVTETREFIMRFFPEGSLFTVVDSFEPQSPSGYRIMALEDITVTYILKSDLEILCTRYHSVETAYRKLLSFASINMMKRISEMLEENATERYLHFLKDYGHWLQRISLGDLASYLGITQVSLSRIRANM